MKKTFLYHTDPGHGWMQVDFSELYALGLAESISRYSYQDSEGNCYLEEDCDMTKFMEAYKAKYGGYPELTEVYHKEDCRIRRMKRYTTELPV